MYVVLDINSRTCCIRTREMNGHRNMQCSQSQTPLERFNRSVHVTARYLRSIIVEPRDPLRVHVGNEQLATKVREPVRRLQVTPSITIAWSVLKEQM
jgi:ABC-type transporter lipoprotein component MlaA